MLLASGGLWLPRGGDPMSAIGSTHVIDQPENAAILRLRSIVDSLSPSERRVADFVLKNAARVVYSSVSSVADGSSVSEATVIRFCRHAGFDGFNDLKVRLAQTVTGPAQHIHHDLVSGDTPGTILKKVFRANAQALVDSVEMIDPSEFERAVEAIDSADKVILIGVGTSGTVALDAIQKFLVAGVNVVAFTDVVLQALSATMCTANDAVIGISRSGATQAVVSALNTAAQQGATTIAVTSRSGTPITEIASISLLLSDSEVSFQSASNMTRRTAHLIVMDALCMSVAMRSPQLFLKNSARLEEISQKLHTKW